MATFCACFLLFQREPAKEKILKKQRIFCRRTKFLRFSGYLFRNSETKKHRNFDTMGIRVAVLFLALFRII